MADTDFPRPPRDDAEREACDLMRNSGKRTDPACPQCDELPVPPALRDGSRHDCAACGRASVYNEEEHGWERWNEPAAPEASTPEPAGTDAAALRKRLDTAGAKLFRDGCHDCGRPACPRLRETGWTDDIMEARRYYRAAHRDCRQHQPNWRALYFSERSLREAAPVATPAPEVRALVEAIRAERNVQAALGLHRIECEPCGEFEGNACVEGRGLLASLRHARKATDAAADALAAACGSKE